MDSDCTYGVFVYNNGIYNFTMNEVVQNKLTSYGAQVKTMPNEKPGNVIYAFDRGGTEVLLDLSCFLILFYLLKFFHKTMYTERLRTFCTSQTHVIIENNKKRYRNLL